ARSRSGRKPNPAFWKQTSWLIVTPTLRAATCTCLRSPTWQPGGQNVFPCSIGARKRCWQPSDGRGHCSLAPIVGIDTDNSGEFINEALITYCKQEHITFTRGRPSLKNDQCFVEQKNGAIVRQVVGYDRLVGEQAYRQLT